MRVGQTGSNQVQSAETSASKKSGKAQAAQGAKEGKEAAPRGAASEDASVSLSSRAKEFSHAKEAAAAAPDVREDKIAELKRRIASGSYSVDANAVADRMVDDHLHSSAMG